MFLRNRKMIKRKMAAYMNKTLGCNSNFLVRHASTILKSSRLCRAFSIETEHLTQDMKEEEEFRVYEIDGLRPKSNRRDRRRVEKRIPSPRFRSMPTDQDWTEVWPTSSTFNWSIVPFPVRQGFIESSIENEGVVPGKYANMELMKIPNFLHLTPPHIKKHCDSLEWFCTTWPDGLETDKKCRHYFPLEHITCDYITAQPSQYDPRSRTVVIKFHLSDLDLDYHARDKFLRLMEDRYDPDTDLVTLESDRCPLKSQNSDFLNFVLTAVYFESWKTEAWESFKHLPDMEKYFWDINKSRKSLMSVLKSIHQTQASSSTGNKLDYLPEDLSDEDALCNLPQVQQYKDAVTNIFDEGENIETLDNYKNAVKQILNLETNL